MENIACFGFSARYLSRCFPDIQVPLCLRPLFYLILFSWQTVHISSLPLQLVTWDSDLWQCAVHCVENLWIWCIYHSVLQRFVLQFSTTRRSTSGENNSFNQVYFVFILWKTWFALVIITASSM